FNSAAALGTAVAQPVLALILVATDWRWVFVVLGIAGVFVGIVWWLTYRNPEEGTLSEADRAVIAHDAPVKPRPSAETSGGFAAWGALFRHGTTWGMILGFFGSV